MLGVLLINPTFGGASGSGQHVKQLYEALSGKVNFEIWDAARVGFLNLPMLRSASFYFRCLMRKVPSGVDVIHIHQPKLAGLFREGYGKLLTVHGDHETELRILYGPISEPIIWYVNREMRKADAITTVSPYWAKIRGWTWVPNMIDLRWADSIAPAGADDFILFVGRDSPAKDYPMFKRIAELTFKELGVKSVALGPLREDTEFLIHRRVPRENVVAMMKRARALVITSRQEGMPSTILEAWASKCPVIARDIPPLRALLDEVPDSMLLFGGEGEALEHIRRVGETASRESLVNAVRERVKEFDSRRVSEIYHRIYEEITRR